MLPQPASLQQESLALLHDFGRCAKHENGKPVSNSQNAWGELARRAVIMACAADRPLCIAELVQWAGRIACVYGPGRPFPPQGA
jgi:hypothetical protein